MAPVPSVASMLASFPEFGGASAPLITQKLTEAARRTNDAVFPTAELVEDAVKLRAAILLILSPFGREMRSESPDQFLSWQYQLKEMHRAATMGIRVF